MLFVVSSSITSDVGPELGRLAKEYQAEIAKGIEGLALKSPLTGIVLFPTVLNPAIASFPDKVTYKRGDGSVFVALNIPYEEWVSSNLSEKIDLICANILASLGRIAKHRLLPEECHFLEAVVERARTSVNERYAGH